MGKSTRGSFTMRTSVISFGILLLVPAILADTFEGESVKVGKKTCTCDFEFTVAGNGKARGTGACDKKCSGCHTGASGGAGLRLSGYAGNCLGARELRHIPDLR